MPTNGTTTTTQTKKTSTTTQTKSDSAKVREGLFEGFKAAGASDSKAIVLICDGRTFIGYGSDSSRGYGWIVTVPEPAGLALLATAGAVVISRDRLAERTIIRLARFTHPMMRTNASKRSTYA